MFQELIQALQANRPLERFEYGDRLFVAAHPNNFTEIQPHKIDPLESSTLNGLVEAIAVLQAEGDDDSAPALVQVVGPNRVKVFGRLHPIRLTRALLAVATKVETKRIDFDSYQSIENFRLMLLTRFDSTASRDKLLEALAHITFTDTTSVIDTGVSQKILVAKGALQAEQEIPKTISLRPYRTFPDLVLQPSSDFVLRFQGEGGSMPRGGLWEADGGLWKIDAIQAIGNWLKSSVDIPVIA